MHKIEKYLGFCKKSNTIIYGFDNIKKEKKQIFFVLLCSSANEKLKTQINHICETRKIKLKVLKDVTIDDILHTNNCKVIALTNENLSKAILESGEWDFGE